MTETTQDRMEAMARLKKQHLRGIINETEYAEALAKITARQSLADAEKDSDRKGNHG